MPAPGGGQETALDDIVRYQKNLPEDRTELARAWKLFEEYSGIPPDQIDEHVTQVVRLPLLPVLHFPTMSFASPK